MAIIFPFKGLLPPVEKVEAVSAVPYDVVNREEAAAKAAQNPLSFLRVSRSEIEMPEDQNPYTADVYEKALANFARLKDEAGLAFDDNASLYVYKLIAGDHEQTGLVCAAAVDDYDNNVIKKHEKTRQQKEDDRTAHTIAIRAHSGPVFLLYRDQEAIDEVIGQIQQDAPLFDFTAEDGVQHILWPCTGDPAEKLVALFATVESTYVADGHHRAKSASRTREAMRSENPNHDGSEAYNRFLAVLFPASQLNILPYNRTVADLNGLSRDEFLEKVKANFSICEAGAEAVAVGDIRMYIDSTWYQLSFTGTTASDAVADQLDVSILQANLLGPILGIDDPRTSNRIDFIGGIHGTARLEELVNSSKAAVAFSMYPTTVEQLIGISDNDEIMPPKSTWFEPKLRDGLVIHCF
ncbi:MAG: DUF1015 family protein [Lentisphaeria bacterium]|nr:DUF1015 family protein [Lentisphaeria bacterium]